MEEQESDDIDISSPVDGEMPPTEHKWRLLIAAGFVLCLGIGLMLGFMFAPHSQQETENQLKDVQQKYTEAKHKIIELERSLTYQKTGNTSDKQGALRNEDKARMLQSGMSYVQAVRQQKAQSAAELLEWFISRWTSLLDFPEQNDRTTRRAETLSQLIGGMSTHLNPKDYIPWQEEFLSAYWVPELHFDLDGDGYPAKRSAKNPRDGFTNVSLCHVAMDLNQLTTDARIMVMPSMHCDRPNARISVFLQGSTLDEALDEFVRAVKRANFMVVDKPIKNVRWILISDKAK